jgi:hypothetical protein
MTLPLTRRIARAALFVAVGAAPVVGAAGSANAAALPQLTNLGPVSALDGAAVGDTLDNGAQQATSLAGEVGSETVKTAVPAAGKTLGKAGKSATGGSDSKGGKGLMGGLPVKTLPIG